MNLYKSKESINKLLDNNSRIRWGILVLFVILFIIILYPSLVITRHQYKLGDVVERDIKASRDFFIEDRSVTEKNRQQAMAEVLTVYDFDANLAKTLMRNVTQAFDDLRAVIESTPDSSLQEIAEASDPVQILPDNTKPSEQALIWEKQAHFEETIGIRVSKGAYQALAAEGFSSDVADLIVKILNAILSTDRKSVV